MPQTSKLLGQMLRGLLGTLWAFVVWTLWLGLVVTLGFQIYIASTNQLEIPPWLLRAMEERLAVYQINAKFGRATLDPTGSLFFKDVQLVLPSFNEPVVTAAGVYVRLDPWELLTGDFSPRSIRVTGANCLVPAMLSNTGKAEPLVRDLDLTFQPGRGGEIAIRSLSARLANLRLNSHGTIYLPESPAATPASARATAEAIARRYAAACRQMLAAVTQLNAFEDPVAEVVLLPSESRTAIASITLTARGLKLENLFAGSATGLFTQAQFPLLGDTPIAVRVELTADQLELPRAIRVEKARVELRGLLTPSRFTFEPSTAELTAASVEAEGVTASAFRGHFTSDRPLQLQADIVTSAMDAPLAVTASADFERKTAEVRFEGLIGSGWLDAVSRHVGQDVRRFVDFKIPVRAERGEVTVGAGWKFERLGARVAVQSVDAYHVHIDEARGHVELTPKKFFASDAWARVGNNFASGSYEHGIPGQEFRFLLDGRLAPLDISGWFTAWWPDFFRAFEFPAGPPAASVDVQGVWRNGPQTTVFVFADAASPVIRGAKLDQVRTRLFIRPGFFDGLEVVARDGSGNASGRFTYQLDHETGIWKHFDFAGASSLRLERVEELIGSTSAEWLKPFHFQRAPDVKARGRLERRGENDYRQDLEINVHSDGVFHLHEFPLDGIRFDTTVRDDDILIANVTTGFAGGTATGNAKITGRGATRKLGFDLALHEASLGRAIATLEQFLAEKEGATAPVPGKFVQEKNNIRLDLTATAEGNFNNALSYTGRGTADLKGAELGEVRLLGGLSEALRFTALRFTTATAAFRIEGPKLVFPEVSVTGDNSAIQAHGEYALDRKELDFNAKLFPFQESGFVLKKILDVALSPLSNVFEVKLTGSLEKPDWALVLGPTNLIRNLTQGGRDEAPARPGDTPPDGAKEAPPEAKSSANPAP
jgi:hypothetical protein